LSTGIHDVNKIKDFLDNFISVVYYVFDRTIVWLVLRVGQYGRPSLATAGLLVLMYERAIN